ncbi:DUF6504 family protein [Citricoccus nitrophenolicus]|uniref:DUF6504 family protein n=2 Tax=Citricoccus nitrophenolicus TaxID=863575 RepID=UPI00360C1369
MTQSVAVTLTTAGVPMGLEMDGRTYSVAAEPVRWYERRKWWKEEHRVYRGLGAGMVDREVWRLQVRLGRARGALHTVDLARHEHSGRWELIRMLDGRGRELREST